MENKPIVYTPTQFTGLTNQVLAQAHPSTLIVGEVANFKVNQGKWVFFDLKDETTGVPCFMPVWNLNTPIEDGMQIVVRGTPKLTQWGRFSFTVRALKPVGEGSLKRAFEMLKKKLAAEGLFEPARKREIPRGLGRIGVISSTGAAGYADFVKILNARWGGMKVMVAHTQVQGLDAPDQMMRALNYFNERDEVDAIVMIRGGGSADDLACFNDERLVRAVAASRIPVMTGIGHEVDTSLVDLAADVRASTPSNAAELLTFDREEALKAMRDDMRRARREVLGEIEEAQAKNAEKVERIGRELVTKCIDPQLVEVRQKVRQVGWGLVSKYIEPKLTAVRRGVEDARGRIFKEMQRFEMEIAAKQKILAAVNPDNVLSQGYAILAGKISPGSVVKITTLEREIEAEIKKVKER